MPPVVGRERRPLPYEALEPEWEAREFRKFQAAAGRQQAPYGAYLFGRLLQSDLHQSCRPALPPDVDKLNGCTIQGMCILQVVDVANIGENSEHRTEFSPAGASRTLKLGLTDGHQMVFGFEFQPLPQFSTKIARGTKIVVENVPVRHGLLLLAVDNCQLLETGDDQSERTDRQRKQSTGPDANGGAYSAALVKAQFNTSQEKASPDTLPTTSRLPIAPASNVPRHNRPVNVPPPPRQEAVRNMSRATTSPFVPNRATTTAPPVFVDAPSSDEDFDSDTTDPMVEHLFYSPNTPREPAAARMTSSTVSGSRKRPRSPSIEKKVPAPAISRSRQMTVSRSSGDIIMDNVEEGPLSSIRNVPAPVSQPPMDPRHPFQYFFARLSTLSSATQTSMTTTLQIRACIKSVIGFQFNTGRYQLRVSVEDCTATREADVANEFVTRLMGVPCSEFVQTMQTKQQVAHAWAATMQFALMNLEGIMTFQVRGAAPLLLTDCRDYQPTDTRRLLQRVKTLMPR